MWTKITVSSLVSVILIESELEYSNDLETINVFSFHFISYNTD